jgi:hypothetical protein
VRRFAGRYREEIAVAVIGQQMGFFIDDTAGNHAAGRSSGNGKPDNGKPGRMPWIEIPSSGVAYLACMPGKSPEVLSEPPDAKGAVLVLETIEYEHQTYLALLPADGVRVNGSPVPPVAILRVGDQLRLGKDCVLHVSRFTRAHVGPPPEECVGQECPVCRIKFVPDTVTYICPHCGRPLHCESPDTATNKEIGPLECARLASECVCQKPIVRQEGYEYVPPND